MSVAVDGRWAGRVYHAGPGCREALRDLQAKTMYKVLQQAKVTIV